MGAGLRSWQRGKRKDDARMEEGGRKRPNSQAPSTSANELQRNIKLQAVPPSVSRFYLRQEGHICRMNGLPQLCFSAARHHASRNVRSTSSRAAEKQKVGLLGPAATMNVTPLGFSPPPNFGPVQQPITDHQSSIIPQHQLPAGGQIQPADTQTQQTQWT
jgi:hypothetical protein